MKKKLPHVTNIKLDQIVGGGQTIGTLENGQKVFAWGGLPGEVVNIQVTKKKSKLAEGVVTEVITPSSERIKPRDADSYLSTSPWQIMNFDYEESQKCALIDAAFSMHKAELPTKTEIFSDGKQFEYRNKIEFSWWYDKDTNQLDLAFFRRGTHGKIPVDGSSLAHPSINSAAQKVRDLLRTKSDVTGFMLKTLLVRCNQKGEVAAQLYVKEPDFAPFSEQEIESLGLIGFEIIYSNPLSPASVITERIQSWGQNNLNDDILGVNFSYALEGFFQINLPVYEQALKDMKRWIDDKKATVDLYSGVGTIGLTIGSNNTTLVEINEHAYSEMCQNITKLKKEGAHAILAPSEKALEYIDADATIIVDPPRAGLHDDVINKLLETKPKRIIYLSCNPVTQGRDTAKLLEKYQIAHHRGYNFFPRTPHIEHLVIFDAKN